MRLSDDERVARKRKFAVTAANAVALGEKETLQRIWDAGDHEAMFIALAELVVVERQKRSPFQVVDGRPVAA